jgi:hypothetical protein
MRPEAERERFRRYLHRPAWARERLPLIQWVSQQAALTEEAAQEVVRCYDEAAIRAVLTERPGAWGPEFMRALQERQPEVQLCLP